MEGMLCRDFIAFCFQGVAARPFFPVVSVVLLTSRGLQKLRRACAGSNARVARASYVPGYYRLQARLQSSNVHCVVRLPCIIWPALVTVLALLVFAP